MNQASVIAFGLLGIVTSGIKKMKFWFHMLIFGKLYHIYKLIHID